MNHPNRQQRDELFGLISVVNKQKSRPFSLFEEGDVYLDVDNSESTLIFKKEMQLPIVEKYEVIYFSRNPEASHLNSKYD